MPDDILSAIDRAVGCQQCGGPLGESASDDFCSETCERAWRAQHGTPSANQPTFCKDLFALSPEDYDMAALTCHCVNHRRARRSERTDA